MKKKRILNWHSIAVAVAMACVVSACSDEEIKAVDPVDGVVEEPEKEEPLPDHVDYVYAAFNEQINGKWVASLWNPGGGIARMSDGTKDALVTSLFMDENLSLYAAGSGRNSKGQHYAKMWFNCSEVRLMDSTSNLYSHADDIFVSNGDVYVAGFRSNGEHTVAMYWKNGTPIDLSSGDTDAYAKEIFVTSDDVYVVGTEMTASNEIIGKLWKNGEEMTLGGTSATSLFVDGTDVYVAGNFGSEMKYWKNGSLVNLDGGTQRSTDAIFVSGGNVYVAGAGSYWKDETSFMLQRDNELKLNSIFVLADDVYVGGAESNGNRDVARFWKNGEPVDVTDGLNDASVTSVIAVRLSAN